MPKQIEKQKFTPGRAVQYSSCQRKKSTLSAMQFLRRMCTQSPHFPLKNSWRNQRVQTAKIGGCSVKYSLRKNGGETCLSCMGNALRPNCRSVLFPNKSNRAGHLPANPTHPESLQDFSQSPSPGSVLACFLLQQHVRREPTRISIFLPLWVTGSNIPNIRPADGCSSWNRRQTPSARGASRLT